MPGDDDDDRTPPRRGRSYWGDDERAAAGRSSRRTPPRGLSIPQSADRDQFTPVTEILDLIEDPKMKRIARLIWEHTANVQMRIEQRMGDETDVEQLRAELVALREDFARQLADLVGADGRGGRVGALTRAVDKLLGRAWWLFTVAVGAVGAAAIKLVIVGRMYGELETEVRANSERLQLIESALFLKQRLVPALMPGKVNEP